MLNFHAARKFLGNVFVYVTNAMEVCVPRVHMRKERERTLYEAVHVRIGQIIRNLAQLKNVDSLKLGPRGC